MDNRLGLLHSLLLQCSGQGQSKNEVDYVEVSCFFKVAEDEPSNRSAKNDEQRSAFVAYLGYLVF